jgi:hypothetical protein
VTQFEVEQGQVFDAVWTACSICLIYWADILDLTVQLFFTSLMSKNGYSGIKIGLRHSEDPDLDWRTSMWYCAFDASATVKLRTLRTITKSYRSSQGLCTIIWITFCVLTSRYKVQLATLWVCHIYIAIVSRRDLVPAMKRNESLCVDYPADSHFDEQSSSGLDQESREHIWLQLIPLGPNISTFIYFLILFLAVVLTEVIALLDSRPTPDPDGQSSKPLPIWHSPSYVTLMLWGLLVFLSRATGAISGSTQIYGDAHV